MVAHPNCNVLVKEVHCVEAIAPWEDDRLQFPEDRTLGYSSVSCCDFVASLLDMLRPPPRTSMVSEWKAKSLVCPPVWVVRTISGRCEWTVDMPHLVAVDTADSTVIAVVPRIVPSKPHEFIACRHVCPNNANVCLEPERAKVGVLIFNQDRGVYCGHTCGEQLEFFDDGMQKGMQVFGLLQVGAGDDSQAKDIFPSKAQFGMQVVVDQNQRVDRMLPTLPKQAHPVRAKIKSKRTRIGQDSFLLQLSSELRIPKIPQYVPFRSVHELFPI